MTVRWVPIALGWIALQLTVTAIMAWSLGVTTPPPVRSYLDVSLCVASLGSIVYAFWLLRTLPPSPVAAWRAADWTPVGRLLAACLCLYGQFITLTWMKCLMPIATHFWGDEVLFHWERWLFGTDAWRIFPAGTGLMETAYVYWPAVVTAVFAYNAMRGRGAACLAFFLTVGGLGVFGQYLLPSAGPIFWKDVMGVDAFRAVLPGSMSAAHDYLWAGYASGHVSPAGGISAFPSVHTGAAAWVALATRHPLGWMFWLLVYGASIAFGWHYATGVTFGTMGAVGCWFLAKWIMARAATITVFARPAAALA